MNIEDNEIEDTESDFIVSVDTSIANALRRTMISKVSTLAINTVSIMENDSILNDEIIAHRIGQIPIKSLGTDITRFRIELNAECPIHSETPIYVYSEDIKMPEEICVVNKKIIILQLRPGEKIKLFGFTESGTGEQHSKWSPCCGTSYEKLDDNLFKFHIETTGQLSPKEVLSEAIQIIIKDLHKYKKNLNS
jgi:DNA-directed RNA polymerase subunit D